MSVASSKDNFSVLTKQEIYVMHWLHTQLLEKPAIEASYRSPATVDISKWIKLVDIISKFLTLFTGLSYCYRNKAENWSSCLCSFCIKTSCCTSTPKSQARNLAYGENGSHHRSHWANWMCVGMVVVPKTSGKVRICVDWMLMWHVLHLPNILHLPNLEVQITSQSYTVDANSGFWHIKMDPQSSEFTTIIMPFWRHKFNRLPESLQPLNISKEILADTEGAVCLIDGVLVYGSI